MSRDARCQERQHEEGEDRSAQRSHRGGLVDVAGSLCLKSIRTQRAIELSERLSLFGAQWRRARGAKRSVAGRGNTVPCRLRPDELQCPIAREPARQCEHDGRDESERQENGKEATTKPNSLHWHLLRAGLNSSFVRNIQAVLRGIHPS